MLFKIASRVGRTVAELENQLDYTEMLEWNAFMEYEQETLTKQDYYLAQIAQCSLIPHAKKGHVPKIKDFLIKFKKSQQTISLKGSDMFQIFKKALGAKEKA